MYTTKVNIVHSCSKISKIGFLNQIFCRSKENTITSSRCAPIKNIEISVIMTVEIGFIYGVLKD